MILSDGGPYRTPAGAVVDRLAGQLGCPVVQLGTGTVRADEETVERAVAEVGEHRLLVSVGSGTLTDIAKVTAQRTGSRHVAVQTACSINGFIADRSVLVVAGAKRTVRSRWPDVLVADTDILSRGAVAVEPRWGGRPFDGPQRGRRVAARRPARSRTARTPPPSSTMSLPRIQSSLHSRGPRATPSRRVSPIWPGCWRPVDCRWESSVRRRRHRAPSTRCRT